MRVPKRGDTVRVMRNGVLYLQLVVAETEPGSHAGWHTIHGGVRHDDAWGGWYEPRSVYAELQEDGSVRMLSTGERLGAATIPGQHPVGERPAT
jgi:hypothetical protein